jgi:hypothetical protein
MAATEIASELELRPNETAHTGLSRTWTAFWAIFLVALRLPFLATHNVQEDAYISLRCARNLALGLGYGFNAGERVSASTAHAFVLLAALLYRICGETFVPVWQLVCAAFIVAAVYCLASAVCADNRQRDLLWILGSVTPIALLISCLGLETSLFILVIGLLILDLRRPLPRWLPVLLLASLSWIRADGAAIGMIYIACKLLRDRRPDFLGLTGVLAGPGSVLVFNRVYFGQWVNQSMVAKQAHRLLYPWHGAFPHAVSGVFFGLGREALVDLFLPLRTRYLVPFAPLFSFVGLLLCVWAVRLAWRNSALRAPLAALLGVGLLMPLPYCWSGFLFLWYFHPSMICLAMLALLFLLRESGRLGPIWRPCVLPATAVLIACLSVGQWALSLSHGTVDYYFIAGVGRHLRSIAVQNDTLFLEPAGYIPYYSQLYTWDEVGIGAPEVTQFEQRYGSRWWPEFVEAKRPTFLVQRPHMLDYKSIFGYALTPEERAWFDRHYKLIDRVAYHPEAYYRNRILQRFAALGSAEDLLVYKLIPESGFTSQ